MACDSAYRPHLSDDGHETQPRRSRRVRCSAGLADVLISVCLFLVCIQQSQQKHQMHVPLPIPDRKRDERTTHDCHQKTLGPVEREKQS